MPSGPPKNKSVNPLGVIGATLFGGVTMILTMLAMLFFPFAAVLGSLLDVLDRLNPLKRRNTDEGSDDSNERDSQNAVSKKS